MKFFTVIILMIIPFFSMAQTNKGLHGSTFAIQCDTAKSTKLVFDVLVSDDGAVSKIQLVEQSRPVPDSTIKRCEDAIRKVRVGPSKEPTAGSGKITICLERKEEN